METWYLIGISVGVVIGAITGAVTMWFAFTREFIPQTIKQLEKEGYLKVLKPMKEKWND